MTTVRPGLLGAGLGRRDVESPLFQDQPQPLWLYLHGTDLYAANPVERNDNCLD